MRLRIFILLLAINISWVMAQEKKSKGDIYFYEYAYADAIREYQNEMQKAKLSNPQLLNLADAYFHEGNYTKASKIYLDVIKQDTLMSNFQFNKMLQSLSKTSEKDRVKAFLNSRKQLLSKELLENSDFNFELLEQNSDGGLTYEIFNVNGNSKQSDFSPAFYKERLLFSSTGDQKTKEVYNPSGEAYLDIYIADIGQNGNTINPEIFTGIPDSKYHKSTPYYAKGNGQLYYILSNTQGDELAFDENGKNALAIGMVDKQGGFKFLLKDLSTSFYYPFYQEATGRLYFAADLDDSYGGTDIYYVNTNGGQIVSQPINLGPRINSPGNEIAPYIIGNSLFFSSDVFYGLGGMDIYKSNIQSDGSFSIPVNLGNGINSTANDFGFIIEADLAEGYKGYFASNRLGGKGSDDLYGYEVDRLPGLKTLVLRGKLSKPESGQAVDNATIQILDEDNNVLKQLVSDENGAYQFEIPWRDALVFKTKKERYSPFVKAYDKNELEELQKTSLNIEMMLLEDVVVEKENQPVLKLKDIFFDTGKSTITPEMEQEFNKVLEIVKYFPQMKLRIESHTDSRGSSASNKKLSQERANAIKAYLLKNGMPEGNLVDVIGYGEERIANNCKEGVYCLDFLHKQNVRTYFIVVNNDQLN
ncbi:MAG: OmpA family protein [Maribacter sp.]|nr:OmpA family protein [Maribacter sp.]